MTVKSRKSISLIDGGKSPGATPGDAGSVWKAMLTENREGKVDGSLHNLIHIFENDERLAGLWWLNESSNQIEQTRPAPWRGGNQLEFTDADSFELTAWLQDPHRYRMACSDEGVLKAVIAVARRYRRHPIREYLTGLVWDGVPRVERMLIDLFGAQDNNYSRQTAQCFAVGAVARMLWFDPKQPFVGAKVDFMLVLEGEQGKRKSSALLELFGGTWFVETSESPSGTEFYQVIQGVWGVEIGEMDSFTKADVTSVKTAITRRVDKFRAPYERMPRSYRRECVFVGTTNEVQYLRDPTGGRRFLPVKTTGDVDLDRIIADRDQLWAEAVHLFEQGFKWWELPPEASEEQAARYVGDSWEGRIEAWLDRRAGAGKYPERVSFDVGDLQWTTTDEVLMYAIGLEAGKHGRPEQMRVAAIMKQLKWRTERRRWPAGGREPRWFPADTVLEDWLASASRTVSARGYDAPDF